MIPRGSVIEALLSKGWEVKKNIHFRKVFEYSEKSFLQKFVVPYKEEASELLQLYKEKMDFPE